MWSLFVHSKIGTKLLCVSEKGDIVLINMKTLLPLKVLILQRRTMNNQTSNKQESTSEWHMLWWQSKKDRVEMTRLSTKDTIKLKTTAGKPCMCRFRNVFPEEDIASAEAPEWTHLGATSSKEKQACHRACLSYFSNWWDKISNTQD